MTTTPLAAFAALVLCAAGAACGGEREEARVAASPDLCDGVERPGVVVIRDWAFRPQHVEVAPGTRVRFVNCDAIGHNVAARSEAWASPLMTLGQSWGRVFEQPGQHPYVCEPHPFMVGTVTVR